MIKTLAESQGHGFVNVYDAFYDSNDELRTKFYGVRDWIHLSSPGTRRLLRTIHRAIPIVEDIRYCAFQQEHKSSANSPNQILGGIRKTKVINSRRTHKDLGTGNLPTGQLQQPDKHHNNDLWTSGHILWAFIVQTWEKAYDWKQLSLRGTN